MRQEPFTNNPSPELFFDSPIHAAAWQVLQAALGSEESFFLLTGDYGTGKTLLCLKSLELLKNEASSLWLHLATPIGGYRELLWRIADALGLDTVAEHDGKDVLQRRIDQYFEAHPEVTLTVLLDEAQEYDTDLLNRLRLLSNPGAGGHVPVRLFLFAHTAFLQRLASPELEALGQRIKRRYHLTELDLGETKEYIYFRLLESGAHGTPYFTDAAVERLWKLSRGVPRCVNNICDVGLLIGMSRGLQSIDISEVEEAVEYLGRSGKPSGVPVSSTSQRVVEPGGDDRRAHEGDVAPLVGSRRNNGSISAQAGEGSHSPGSSVRGHYVVAEEVPSSEPPLSITESVVSPSFLSDTYGDKGGGGSLWGWRLLVLLLLLGILVRLVSGNFPDLLEWFDQQMH